MACAARVVAGPAETGVYRRMRQSRAGYRPRPTFTTGVELRRAYRLAALAASISRRGLKDDVVICLLAEPQCRA